MPTRHLLTVWNPSYASDALDEHLRVLLRWADRSRGGEADPEDVYVWWAKLRSKNRTGPLPHAADVRALQGQIDAQVETHLYLTDFRSLYVGHLAEITSDDVLRRPRVRSSTHRSTTRPCTRTSGSGCGTSDVSSPRTRWV